MFCELTLGTDFHIFHQELLSEGCESGTVNCPYKKKLKAIAIVKPSEFDYSLAKCGDNFYVPDLNVAVSERCHFDYSIVHICD